MKSCFVVVMFNTCTCVGSRRCTFNIGPWAGKINQSGHLTEPSTPDRINRTNSNYVKSPINPCVFSLLFNLYCFQLPMKNSKLQNHCSRVIKLTYRRYTYTVKPHYNDRTANLYVEYFTIEEQFPFLVLFPRGHEKISLFRRFHNSEISL